MELKTRMTRGSSPRPLTPDEIKTREAMRDALVTRMAIRVNTHTTTEIERCIGTVNNHTAGVVAEAVGQVKDCFKESFCPEVSTTAPATERLAALKARHSIERGLMVQLRKEAAEDRARPKPRRAAVKVETTEPKEPKGKKRATSASTAANSTATSSTGDGEVATFDAPVPVEKRTNPKRLCGALCRGAKQKPGKTCRKPFPCMFHPVAAAPGPREDLDAEDAKDGEQPALGHDARKEVPDEELPDLGGGRRFVKKFIPQTDYSFDLPDDADAPAAEAALAAEEEME